MSLTSMPTRPWWPYDELVPVLMGVGQDGMAVSYAIIFWTRQAVHVFPGRIRPAKFAASRHSGFPTEIR